MYTSNRTSQNKKSYYEKYPRTGDCQFCLFKGDEIVKEIGDFLIVRNKFQYDIFDMCEVVDHLMVTPKEHTEKLSTLSNASLKDFIKILTDYEDQEYNVFFREPKSQIKTVSHHHTHLLKLGKRLQTINYTKDPYMLTYS